jgi:hypothetical protein
MKHDRSRVIGGPYDGAKLADNPVWLAYEGVYAGLSEAHRPSAGGLEPLHRYITVAGFVVYVGVVYDLFEDATEEELRRAGLMLGMVKG